MTTFALAVSQETLNRSPDEDALIAFLRTQGATAEKAVWNDPAVDWRTFDRIVIRSTWDYHHHARDFLTWCDARHNRLVNPPEIIRWNANKRYLLDLQSAGIAIPQTVVIPAGQPRDLVTVMWEHGIELAVVKLAVSAGAWGAILMDRERAYRQGDDVIQALTARSDVLVQAYVPEIKQGELSLMFFDGEFSHAVRKVPAERDYRTQEAHGGRIERVDPAYGTVKAASLIVEQAAQRPTYARVDVVETADGVLLMELELIEPSLFLSYDQAAVARFGQSLLDYHARRA